MKSVDFPGLVCLTKIKADFISALLMTVFVLKHFFKPAFFTEKILLSVCFCK